MNSDINLSWGYNNANTATNHRFDIMAKLDASYPHSSSKTKITFKTSLLKFR